MLVTGFQIARPLRPGRANKNRFTANASLIIPMLGFAIMASNAKVAIQGGLGNQLFQWFFAHEYAFEKKFKIYQIFPTAPKISPVRFVEIQPLIDRCNHIQLSPNNKIGTAFENLVPKIFDRLWELTFLSLILNRLGYYREDPRRDTRSHAQRPRRLRYAAGYFMNWKIPNRHIESVKEELLPFLDEIFYRLGEKFDLHQPYTVVHVRRYEATANQDPRTTMASLADQFYEDWLQKHPNQRLIILTEKRSSIESLISKTQPFLVFDQNNSSAWETLAIMSHASSILGSNSTLSWWGVWTSHLRGGSTFYPSSYDVTEARFDDQDLLFPGCTPVMPIWCKPNS